MKRLADDGRAVLNNMVYSSEEATKKYYIKLEPAEEIVVILCESLYFIIQYYYTRIQTR